MKENNNKATIPFVLSIVSVCLGLIEFNKIIICIAIILGLFSITYATILYKSNKSFKTFFSIVMGIVGIVIALIWLHMYFIVK